jgi:predicted nucleic acid-binding Zn ribbon protein
MSSAQCPNCGLAIADATAICPLCRANLIRVNTRRVLLWSTIIAEYVLLGLVLHLRG